MKFGKQLETEAEGIPSEWRPYLIQYKALKKLITKVAEEIESRGLSTSLLHECLEEDSGLSAVNDEEDESIPKIKYYFTGEPPNVKPNIEFTYDSKEPKVQKVLEKLLSSSTSASDQVERPKLEFKRSHNNKDFFALSPAANAADEDASANDKGSDQHDETALEDCEQQQQEERIAIKSPAVKRQRRSSTVTLVKELLTLTLEEKDKIKDIEKEDQETEEVQEKHEKHIKTLVVELEQDDEFFKMLMEELQQAAMLQDVTTQKFQHDISDLETRMTKVAAPTQKQTCTIGARFSRFTWMHRYSREMQSRIEHFAR
ncbi:unnamed protein product [Mucor fragilis]